MNRSLPQATAPVLGFGGGTPLPGFNFDQLHSRHCGACGSGRNTKWVSHSGRFSCSGACSA